MPRVTDGLSTRKWFAWVCFFERLLRGQWAGVSEGDERGSKKEVLCLLLTAKQLGQNKCFTYNNF